MYSEQCTLYNVQCTGTVHAEQCILYSVQLHDIQCILLVYTSSVYTSYLRLNPWSCTLYTIHYTVYSVQCTVYSVQCTLYSVQCTMYSVQCTVYSVQCTVYSVQCTAHATGYTLGCPNLNSFEFILNYYWVLIIFNL